MNSLAFLRQMLQDVRQQKLRTLLTLLGITWGTVSVSLLVAFGEGLQKRIEKNQRGLGENIVIAWPSRTSIPYQGLGKGRRLRVSEEDLEALRAIHGRPGREVVGHLRLYTARALREFVAASGFEVVRLHGAPFHGVPRPLRPLDRLACARPSLASILLLHARRK